MGLYRKNQPAYPQMNGGLYVQDPEEVESEEKTKQHENRDADLHHKCYKVEGWCVFAFCFTL